MKKNNESIVESIHERIKEAELKKDELEAMLERVRDSIEGIDSLEGFSQEHRKPNVEDKNQSIKKLEESKQKSELNAEKLKKFKEDQKKKINGFEKKIGKSPKTTRKRKKTFD